MSNLPVQTPNEVRADAKSRSFRTLVMGFVFDVLATLGVVVLPVLAGMDDLSSKAQWVVVGTLVGKTFLTSLVSYVARLKVAPKYEDNQITLIQAQIEAGKNYVGTRLKEEADRHGIVLPTSQGPEDYEGRG